LIGKCAPISNALTDVGTNRIAAMVSARITARPWA
jgi:hypothetical protein